MKTSLHHFPFSTALLIACLWLNPHSTRTAKSDVAIPGPLVQTLQMPGKGLRGSGFTTSVQVSEQNAAGYTSIKITITAQGSFTADRNFVYRFQTLPAGTSPPQNGMTIDVPITVNQGMKSKSFDRNLPKWHAGQLVDVSVLEDGSILEDYTARYGNVLGRGSQATMELLERERQLTTLFIGDGVPASLSPFFPNADPRIAPQAVSRSRQLSVGTPLTFQANANATKYLQSISESEVGPDWRSFNRYDWVVLDVETLNRMRDVNPNGFEALRNWILTGGTLLVHGADGPISAVDSLRFAWNNKDLSGKLVGTAASLNKVQLSKQAGALRREAGWLGATADAAKSSTPAESQKLRNEAGRILMEAKQIEAQLTLPRDAWSERIWVQPAAAGIIITLRRTTDDSFPAIASWKIAAEVSDFRKSATLRRGVDPLIGDRRFTQWLIPGVAEPPVYTFMGLLTLFVLLVGPVAYRQTTKHGRGYMMFAIAPVLAMVTTLAMLGYGIVSDGFGTSVRMRQLTWVDGESGDASERLRATYFAGVRPSKPLQFSGDAEIMIYPVNEQRSWEQKNTEPAQSLGKVVVEENVQLLDPAFLPSRQQRQFISHRPRPGFGSLEIVPGENFDPAIESTLAIDLTEVIFRDKRGHWRIESLGAGQTKTATKLSPKNVSDSLFQPYKNLRLLQRSRNTRRRNFNQRHTYDVISELHRAAGLRAEVTDGVFEHYLQATNNDLEVNHFVATSPPNKDVLAVDDCEVVQSVHYVFGTLR
ncbi:MAG: hypothetical protein AB8B91_08255 [Rubripirellula sp.]